MQQYREDVGGSPALFRSLVAYWRWVAAAFIMTTLGGWFGYTLALVHRVNALQTELSQLHSHVGDIDKQRTTVNAIQDKRLDNLEFVLFGAKPPTTPTAVELWQKNRDKDLRDSIAALQRRIAVLEGKK